jgi:hypothetical protein
MGRPPIGKVAMTGAERTRLYRLRRGPAKPAPKSDAHAALKAENAALKAAIEKLKAQGDGNAALRARIAELEMQLAHERSAQAAAEAEPSKPGGNEAMGKRVFKLVLRLDSPNDNEALLAARKLVRELKAIGSDLRTLAAALETEWEKQQKAKPAPPPPIDFSEVEAAVKRYAADRTTVNFNRMWRALKAEVPALDVHRGRNVAHYLMGCLRRLGFAGSSSNLTWHRK